MIDSRMEFRAEEQDFGSKVAVWLIAPITPFGDTRRHVGQRALVTLVPVEDGVVHESTFLFDKPAAQRLMTELWRIGLRPHGFEGPHDNADLRAHLADMRRLYFHSLGGVNDLDGVERLLNRLDEVLAALPTRA